MKNVFSWRWVVFSVAIFTALELLFSLVVAPAILSGRFAAPMVNMRIQMVVHLFSYALGGFIVGLVSPGVRLWEPAVAAFIAVALVLLMSVFLPNTFLRFETWKLYVGGGIAFVLALSGAYSAEKLMGNVEVGDATRRGRVRKRMWGKNGLLVSKRDREHSRRY